MSIFTGLHALNGSNALIGLNAAGAAIGAALGALHVWSLWRSARRPSALGAIFGLLRLTAIAILLAFAAMGGVLPATAAGWAFGFAVSLLATLAASRKDHEAAR